MLNKILDRLKDSNKDSEKIEERITHKNLPFVLKVFYYIDSHRHGWLPVCGLDRVLPPEKVLEEGLVRLTKTRTSFGVFDGYQGPALYTYPEEPNWKQRTRKKKKIITRNGFTMYQFLEDEEDAKINKELGIDA